jgi:Tol biopolymer transport system component
MRLTPGSRIGPYEITSALGAGGMGEVYRARDTKLGRDVALKILPEVFAADPDRLARFEREAKALAALNHPHIAQIHGLEDQGGVRALVMELVEGPTLAERIAEGPIPLQEAAPIARQIAEALEAAHDAGIIHRDLKPANIKVRDDGTVKVLDFGLAKALEGARNASGSAGASLANSPTLSVHATVAGIILGTAAYMSPEQVRGRRIDRRADIWAFGCVLFEMLSGQSPFRGDSINDLMGAVIGEEPEWRALPATLPRGIPRLIQRCLQKDPRQRLHDIADARLDLEEALSEPVGGAAESVAVQPLAAWRRVLPWAVASLLLVVAGVQTWRASGITGTGITSPVRFAILPPAGLEAGDWSWPLAALSPDGTRVVLSYDRGGTSALYQRSIGQLEATLIPGTEDGHAPFFSPDGKWIAFATERQMRKVALDGGAPVTLCECPWGGGTWGPDDTIVYTPDYTDGLFRLPAGGGAPRQLTVPDNAKGELGHWWPQFLPDGKTILFTNFSTPIERSRLETYALDTGTRTTIVEGATFGRYTPTGHLLFARGESVMAVRFDARTLKVTGQPTPVLDGVAGESSNGQLDVSMSANGTLAYVPATAFRVANRLVWIDRKGTVQPVTTAAREFADPRVSPDGRRVALTITQEGDRDVWMYDLDRGTFTRVTAEKARQFVPIWTPDGRSLFFSFEEPVYHIYRRPTDGTRPAERVFGDQYDARPRSFTPDGRVLLFQHSSPKTRGDLLALPLDGGEPRSVVQTPSDDSDGRLSPDGRSLAFVSDESGRREVYVQPFPQGGQRVQISIEGGYMPIWSRDGRELFFLEGKTKLMSVPIAPGKELSPGRPALLFEGRFDFGYDVTPDGRFIVAQRDPQAPPVPVHIVLNWHEELLAKVPVK